jgi:hypothetical protein
MRQEAALLATLFLNFAFWYLHGNALWLPYSLPFNAVLIAIVAAMLTLLFLALPALAVYRMRNGLFGAVECSLGTLPTLGIRFCALWFVATSLEQLLGIVSWQLPNILRRDTNSRDILIAAVLVLAYLGYTAWQSGPTNVTLAKFTNRLAIAFLLAAAIRLYHAGPYGTLLVSSSKLDFHRLSGLACDLAPLGFLGAAYAQRIDSEKKVWQTGMLGFALPLGATLLAVSTINAVTFHSRFYRPSSEPNIAMALWGGAAHSWIPGTLLIVLITNFGAARFVIRAIPAAIPKVRLQLPALITVLAATIALYAWPIWTERQPFRPDFEPQYVVLAITTAILAADALHNRPAPPKRIDWPATTALLVSFALGYGISQSSVESWSNPWLFPSYATAFTITLLARKLSNLC